MDLVHKRSYAPGVTRTILTNAQYCDNTVNSQGPIKIFTAYHKHHANAVTLKLKKSKSKTYQVSNLIKFMRKSCNAKRGTVTSGCSILPSKKKDN